MLAPNQLPQASIPPIFTAAPLVSQFLSEPVYANGSLGYRKLEVFCFFCYNFFLFTVIRNFTFMQRKKSLNFFWWGKEPLSTCWHRGWNLTQEDTDYLMISSFLCARSCMQMRAISVVIVFQISSHRQAWITASRLKAYVRQSCGSCLHGRLHSCKTGGDACRFSSAHYAIAMLWNLMTSSSMSW